MPMAKVHDHKPVVGRPEKGRSLFYTRDSGGGHETTPAEYVRWTAEESRRQGLRFGGTPEEIDRMVRERASAWSGDLFLDWDVSGNIHSRLALDALFAEVARDRSITHVFIPRPDRLSRPNDAEEGVELEKRLRRMGVSVVFRSKVRGPLNTIARQ